ncbi:MAG: MFS transporter [Clostridia bacterium]|nr:MFS transporter [Clostridia bacterium]
MTKDIYKTSRICYIIEETTAYLITFLITGAYLAKLTLSLGFSDSLTALLGSFVNLGCVFQLFAIAIFRRGSAKRKLTILYTINELLFALLYLVPFLNINSSVKTALFIAFLLGGYFIFNTVSSPKTNMFMALIPDNRRGTFTAYKEAISLVSGVAFRFSMGLLIDYFNSRGNMIAAFITCGVTIVALMIMHTLSLIFAKEKDLGQVDSGSVLNGIKEVIFDKRIAPILIISIMWTTCNAICTPFLGTYQVKELGFSMTYVAVLSAINAGVRIIASVFLGRYADKNSFAKMLKICYGLVALSFVAITFTTPANGYLTYMIYEIFMAAAMGGINSAEINLIFDYAIPEKRKNALSVKYAFCGVCGFFATLAVTPLVNYIQRSGNRIFGVPIYAQQILSLVSLTLSIVLILFIDKVVIRKNK